MIINSAADSLSTRKKLLLSMILLCFVSITCVNSLKCCNYVTPGVIRYFHWGMSIYTLVWAPILYGV